jgi:preprotein translocase subunit SecE
MSRISNYILETKAEMKRVSWPTRKQTIVFTIIIILVSLGVSIYLGLFDYIFSIALQRFIGF